MKPSGGDSLSAQGGKLLRGGMAGSAAVSVLVLAVVGFTVSQRAAIGLLVGAAVGLAVMAGGQIVLVFARELRGVAILGAALGAYAGAIVGVLLLLRWISDSGALVSLWVGIGILVGSNGYLVGAIFAYRRLRVLVFTPSSTDDQKPGSDG